jgi:hypothetical protein
MSSKIWLPNVHPLCSLGFCLMLAIITPLHAVIQTGRKPFI